VADIRQDPRPLENPHPDPTSPLGQKLKRIWHTPIIDNPALRRGEVAIVSVSPSLGEFVRLTQWNIEKSIEIGKGELLYSFTIEAIFWSLIRKTSRHQCSRQGPIGRWRIQTARE